MTVEWITRRGTVAVLVVLTLASAGLLSGRAVRDYLTEPPVLGPDKRPPVTAEYELAAQLGEKFPNGACFSAVGAPIHLSDLWGPGPTVLLFWALDCEPCAVQSELWNLYMVPELRRDVKQVVCLPREDSARVKAHEEELRGKTVVFIDVSAYLKAYNLAAYPTIVSVDSLGIITHVQYESSPSFDSEFLAYLSDD